MPVCRMKYEGYSVPMQTFTQNLHRMIEPVGKHQDRVLDENDYLGEKCQGANLRLPVYKWA